MDMNLLSQILGIAFEKRVSDLHFEVDNPPFFRAKGQLLRSKLPKLTPRTPSSSPGPSWSRITGPSPTSCGSWTPPTRSPMAGASG